MLSNRSRNRGVIVLDKQHKNLALELQARNIRVVIIPKGTDDDTIKRSILPHRILVTDNFKRYKDDVSSFEYGLISTKIKDPIVLAKRISDEITKNKLWSLRQGFILKLHKKKTELEEVP